MKMAVIKTGGKQYLVKEGDKLQVETLPNESRRGNLTTFNEVLLMSDAGEVKVGNPTVAGATVTAEIVKDDRHDKITVIHYKAKVRHRKKAGHRQPYTEVKITGIKG
ncbi:MAG: 50S ribosomal protein L21 [Patescibacteria group bacterium]